MLYGSLFSDQIINLNLVVFSYVSSKLVVSDISLFVRYIFVQVKFFYATILHLKAPCGVFPVVIMSFQELIVVVEKQQS